MILLEGNVWVGSPSGVVKLYNAVSKLPIGHWNSKLCITEMVHLPNGYYDDDKQALLVLAKPSSIVVFTQLDRQSSKLIDTIVPDHIIKLHGDPICALLMPTLHQLWVCTTDNQLNVFCTGCYDNLPMKCANPHGACCMATEKDCVLIASGSAVHKWSPCQSPTCVTSLNCEATIMEKIPNYEGNSSRVSNCPLLYINTFYTSDSVDRVKCFILSTRGVSVFVIQSDTPSLTYSMFTLSQILKNS